jgi:hypothetical protein
MGIHASESEHALPAVAEAHQDFYTTRRRAGGGVEPAGGAILFPEKVQSKWKLSNGHARSCAPKLQGMGKDGKLGADVPSSPDPACLQFVVAIIKWTRRSVLYSCSEIVCTSTADEIVIAVLVLQPQHVIAVLAILNYTH